MSTTYWDSPSLRPEILPLPTSLGLWGWLKSAMTAQPTAWHRETRSVKEKRMQVVTNNFEPQEPIEEPASVMAVARELALPSRHDDMKRLIKAMNYGEMVEYAKETMPEGCNDLMAYMDRVWAWAVKE